MLRQTPEQASLVNKLRGFIVQVTETGERRSFTGKLRNLVAGAARLAKTPENLMDAAHGIAETMEAHAAETSTWVDVDTFRQQGGRFDSCDLRHWGVLAEKAGIPFIEARPILELTQREIGILSGQVKIPDSLATRRIQKAAAELIDRHAGDLPPSDDAPVSPEEFEAIQEKCFAAMDGVPEGWMVRHSRCGAATLKALAGCGIAGPEAPEVQFGPGLEVGPGWVREGNRRKVNVTDGRIMKVGIAPAPDINQVWLARPWMTSSRFTVCEDPHRQGGPVRGKGIWPAEWRAFIENGKVVGVSYYYPWAGEAQPLDAYMATHVREAAQAIADAGVQMGAEPALFELEMARIKHPEFGPRGFEERFPRHGFSGTVDFLETDHGLVVLEGGPPCTPFGGAHPCGFLPVVSKTLKIEGVALRIPDGVHMMEPSTWNVDLTGSILSWEENEVYAALFERRLNTQSLSP